MSDDERFESAAADFWEAGKELMNLRDVDLLEAATGAMQQQVKVSGDVRLRQASTRFWQAKKELINLRDPDLLEIATDAMKQQAREYLVGVNGPRPGCVCHRCVELRGQIAAREELKAQLADVCEPGTFDDA
jgi:hypothetical protein